MLSESVYKALIQTGDAEVMETVKFVFAMDRFFDCMNVSNFTSGKHKRKVFQQPYRSAKDFRLTVRVELSIAIASNLWFMQGYWRGSFFPTWTSGRNQ